MQIEEMLPSYLRNEVDRRVYKVKGLSYESDRGVFIDWQSPNPALLCDLPEFSVWSEISIDNRAAVILFPIVEPCKVFSSFDCDFGSAKASGICHRQKFQAHPPLGWDGNCFKLLLVDEAIVTPS